MQDTEGVQTDVTSQGETLPEVLEPQEQPLTEEKVKQLIAEERERAIGEGKELGRREMQSIKDAEVAKVQREAKFAQTNLARMRQRFTELDPDSKALLESEDLRSEVDFFKQKDAEEASRRKQEEQGKALQDSLKAHLEDLGIEPNDKRVDWADDATDYVSGRRRFDASITKILRDKEKSVRDELKETVKAEVLKARKELGLDSEDLSTPSGIGSSVPTDMAKFRTWVDALSKEEYKKREKEIDELMRKGLIK